MKKTIALLDCDSFYASCEKVFRPDLANKPVVVLSNNDGFIISLSKEAKALGFENIKPYHECKDELVKKGVHVFSANFNLYGQLSHRVVSVIHEFLTDVEIYSIDEAFLDLTREKDPSQVAKNIKQAIWKWIGVPVTIGIGETKSLAKIATKIAKRDARYKGVCNLCGAANIDEILSKFPVEWLWGVGHRLSKNLNEKGVITALDFKNAPEPLIKRVATIQGVKIARELKGESCIDKYEVPEERKSILRSRTFGTRLKDLDNLKEALSSYATMAAESLREQKCACRWVQVFIDTYSKEGNPSYSASFGKSFPYPTADTSIILKQAHSILETIFKDGYLYLRAGVVLSDFVPIDSIPQTLFEVGYNNSREKKLMDTIDRVNLHMGRDALFFASSGVRGKLWFVKQANKSPNYMSDLGSLPKAK